MGDGCSYGTFGEGYYQRQNSEETSTGGFGTGGGAGGSYVGLDDSEEFLICDWVSQEQVWRNTLSVGDEEDDEDDEGAGLIGGGEMPALCPRCSAEVNKRDSAHVGCLPSCAGGKKSKKKNNANRCSCAEDGPKWCCGVVAANVKKKHN